METVFNISNSPPKTIGVDAAYAMKWDGLIKLMTEVYCPRNEIQNMETELWNLTVKGNDLTAYTQRATGQETELETRLETRPEVTRLQQRLTPFGGGTNPDSNVVT
ncbi:hypothetical protein Tco_0119395, partial [Tanacetum coccineum]